MNTLVSGVYEIAILGDVILVNCVIKDGHGYLESFLAHLKVSSSELF